MRNVMMKLQGNQKIYFYFLKKQEGIRKMYTKTNPHWHPTFCTNVSAPIQCLGYKTRVFWM